MPQRLVKYNDQGQRWCSQGKHHTDTSLFGRDKNRTDGFNSSCRSCIRDRTKELSATRRPKRSEMPAALAPPDMKWCYKCQSYKPFEAFYRSKRERDGRMYMCKRCHLDYDTRDHYEKTYGIARSIVDALWDTQDGHCAICNKDLISMSEAHFDHCHETKEARGFLCHNCNVGIGHLRDDVTLLKAAIRYLGGGE